MQRTRSYGGIWRTECYVHYIGYKQLLLDYSKTHRLLAVINKHMTTDIQKLEKLIKEQNKQIESLKKGISGLQAQVQLMSKKINRTYHSGKSNTNYITKILGILGKNR